MLNWGLGYVIDLIAQIRQKFVEVHRRSIDCSWQKSVHVHGWYFKVFVADRLKAYDAEVKRSLIRNDVAVLLLFCCALY